MCERCNRQTPFDTPEKLNEYFNMCFAYGQDLGKRQVERDEAIDEAYSFCEGFVPTLLEGKIGMGFVSMGYYEPNREPIPDGEKGMHVFTILMQAGHAEEAMYLLVKNMEKRNPNASINLEFPDSDETIH